MESEEHPHVTSVGQVAQPGVLVPLLEKWARKPFIAGFSILLDAICLAHILSKRLAGNLASPDRQRRKDRVSFGQIAPHAVPALFSSQPGRPFPDLRSRTGKTRGFMGGTYAGGFPMLFLILTFVTVLPKYLKVSKETGFKRQAMRNETRPF